MHHWIGTLLVFVGTLIFTEMLPFKLNKSNGAASADGKTKQN